MKKYTPKTMEALVDSLVVYWKVLRRSWIPLLIVFLLCEIAMAACRMYLSANGATGVELMQQERVAETLISMTIGLVAAAIALDRAFRICCGQNKGTPGGVLSAWGRIMATAWLRLVACTVIVAVVIVLSVLLYGVLNAPKAHMTGASFAMVVFACGASIVVLSLIAVWILVRWMFSTEISVVHSLKGSSAMKASTRYCSGRLSRCVLFAVVAALVSVGIGSVPAVVDLLFVRGGLLGLSSITGPVSEYLGIATQLLTGVCEDFAGLFVPVALLVFLLGSDDRWEVGEFGTSPRIARLCYGLMAVGVAVCALAVAAGLRLAGYL